MVNTRSTTESNQENTSSNQDNTSETIHNPSSINTEEIQQPPETLEEQTTYPISTRPTLQPFDGKSDAFPIENWLNRYQHIATHHAWNEEKRCLMLGNYLKDDALAWYLDSSDIQSWDALRTKIIQRFGVPTVEPIVDFFYLKYDPKLGFKDYFEKKRRLGNLSKLSSEQMIPIMVQGLTQNMISVFTTVKPKTLDEFYQIGQTAEKNCNRFKPILSDKKFDQKPKHYTNKPPRPCKICEKLGYQGRYHWMSDCRNKGKSPSNKSANIVKTDSENDITSITLN